MILCPDDKPWLCCCGKIHVEKGALYVGYFSIVIGIVTIFGIFFILPIGILLVFGIRKSQPKRIIPHLVLQIFYMLVLVGVLAFGIALIATNGRMIYGGNNFDTGFTFETETGSDVDTINQRSLKHAWTNYGVLITTAALFGIAIQGHIFWVLLQAYKSIKIRQNAGI